MRKKNLRSISNLKSGLSTALLSARRHCCAGGIPSAGFSCRGAFIETLATNAIALDVGRWIILTACHKAAAWRGMGLSPGRIGINVFPPQFQGDVLLKAIDDALHETKLPPESIEIEITENSTLNYEGAAETLQKLHEKRVGIAFDDFGTGYASLSYLTRFPINNIEIADFSDLHLSKPPTRPQQEPCWCVFPSQGVGYRPAEITRQRPTRATARGGH